MDLAKLDLEAAASSGIKVKLTHPVTQEVLEDSKGKPLVIVILGRDSKQWQREAKKQSSQQSKKYKGSIPTDQVEKSLRKIMAACTIEFPNNNIEFEGKKVKCEPEAVLELYNARPWIAEQMAQAAADRSQLFLGPEEN